MVFNPQAGRPNKVPGPAGQVLRAVDETTFGLSTTSVTVPVYAATAITLNQFPNYASYTSLFDQYRCDLIEVWIEPSVLMSSTVKSTLMYSAIDLDDANNPSSLSQVSGHQSAICSEAGTSHYHKWKPHMAVAAYSGTFTSYSNEPAGWIDCASPGVQHFGVKFATSSADGVARDVSITVRAHWSFRAVGI
jgi:hypothetical protein